jgi:hypothetical protein
MSATLTVADMETHSNDDAPQPIDPIAALHLARDAQGRLAARVRSPWWVHLLRGVLVAAVVFGASGTENTPWLLLGVVGLIALARRRVREVGVARSNPERWRFLTLGAPWSVIALSVAVAGMAFLIVVQHESAWQVAVAVTVAGIVTAVTGPLADAAARRRLAGDPVGGRPGGVGR